MKLRLSETDPHIIKEAEAYFPDDYIDELMRCKKDDYNEEIVSRYLVSLLAREESGIDHFMPGMDYENQESDDFFYFISHKPGVTFVGVGEDVIGSHVENRSSNDIDVSDCFTSREIDILGGDTEENMLTGWTAKNTLADYLELGTEDIEDIEIYRFMKEQKKIGDMQFEKALVLNYEDNFFKAYVGSVQDGKIFYGVVI